MCYIIRILKTMAEGSVSNDSFQKGDAFKQMSILCRPRILPVAIGRFRNVLPLLRYRQKLNPPKASVEKTPWASFFIVLLLRALPLFMFNCSA
jgi:hypothetical protein